MLIFTTLILISSIRNGITENFETEYNDYHFVLKDISAEQFNQIKDKKYIDKIYIQENNEEQLKQVDTSYTPQSNVTVYLKYKNIRDVCNCTTDIAKTIGLSSVSKYEFNEKLLTVYGFIDVTIEDMDVSPVCTIRVNFSYVIDIMIILILVAFSVLFIIILYNAFLITINERKKEYAILNSVGGTEGQILKTIFLEAIIMGAIGIVIGGFISLVCSNAILNALNNTLQDTGYNFRLVLDGKYIILALIIIVINIYMSVLIPSVTASTTSVIQGVRGNKQIKRKKRKSILEKILPIEGKMAIRNIKRNRSKYRIITILLVICMTSYIAVSTYIKYEEETANLVTEWDIDACIIINPTLNIDYKAMLNDYVVKSGDKIEYMEYKCGSLEFLVEPTEAIINDKFFVKYIDNKRSTFMNLIGLDDKTYNKYIDKVNGKNGDFIIYNNRGEHYYGEKTIHIYYPVFNKDDNLKLIPVDGYYTNYNTEIDEWEYDYNLISSDNLNGNFILTDELIEGFMNFKIQSADPILFVNMETYNKISSDFKEYIHKSNSESEKSWMIKDDLRLGIKCNNIMEFKNYIEDINKKQNIEIVAGYFSLQNQEKIVYINIIQLILKLIILVIVIIGVVSTINIINASLVEREQDFKILNSLGGTKENIKKILIYECIYMFIKAVIISIIISIPIIDVIVKYMENIIILDKLLIPYGSIGIFMAVLFLISLVITLYSTKMIKEDK